MGKTALSIGGDTFAFFTRNPRGGGAKAMDPEDARELMKLMEKNDFGPLVAHAPYTLNPASANPKVREFAKLAMGEDLQRLEHLPGSYYNFHPGSHTGQGTEKGIRLISELLNQVLTEEQTTVVLLETMAGKGSEIGGDFSELRAIIDRVELKDKVGVCMDTCHVSDGGYDIKNDLEGVLDLFDKTVGMDKLKALHINDSLNPAGSRKDRHARIGEGWLGLEAIRRVVHEPRLKNLPCILETPQESVAGYGREIALLREDSC